jgi:hypothetical protein
MLRQIVCVSGIAVVASQVDDGSFWLKIGSMGVFVVYVCLFLTIQFARFGTDYLFGPQRRERARVMSGEISLEQLRSGAWHVNSQTVANFCIFSFGALIAAVTYVFTENLQGNDLVLFQILLFVFGVSVLCFFVSLQLWFLALDVGNESTSSLRSRNYATTFQVVGWYGLQSAGTLALLIVSTALGFVFGFLACGGIIMVYEQKARLFRS